MAKAKPATTKKTAKKPLKKKPVKKKKKGAGLKAEWVKLFKANKALDLDMIVEAWHEAKGHSLTNLTPIKKSFIEALARKAGTIYHACEAIGISRQTFYEWRNTDAEFKLAYENVKQQMIDLTENRLMKNINDGKEASIIFFLKTIGRERGYVEKIEHDHTHNHALKELEGLGTEALIQIAIRKRAQIE